MVFALKNSQNGCTYFEVKEVVVVELEQEQKHEQDQGHKLYQEQELEMEWALKHELVLEQVLAHEHIALSFSSNLNGQEPAHLDQCPEKGSGCSTITS